MEAIANHRNELKPETEEITLIHNGAENNYSTIDLSENTQTPEEPLPPLKKWSIFIIVVLEAMLFGGNVFGWAQLAYLLKTDGVYSHLCSVDIDNATSKSLLPSFEHNFRGCHAQDTMMTIALSLGIVFYTISGFVMGYSLHRFGVTVTRLINIPLNIIGFVLIGFTSHDMPYLIHPGVIILSIGNAGLRGAGLQFGDLFPKNRSTALSVLTGSQGMSAGVFIFVFLAVDSGVSRSSALFFLAGIAALSFPATLLMPYYNVRQYTKGALKLSSTEIESSLKTNSAILAYLWMVLLYLGMDSMSAFFNPWISKISQEKEEAAYFSALFSASMFFAPVIAFIPGMLTDCHSRYIQSCSGGQRAEDPVSCGLPILVTTFVSTVKIMCFFFHSPWAIYLILFCVMYSRPTIPSVFATYLRIRFPQEHFDRLFGYGIGMTVVDPLIVNFLFKLTLHNYLLAIVLLFCLQLLTFLFPLYVFLTKYSKPTKE